MKKTYLFVFTFLALCYNVFSQETSESFTFDSENRTYLLYIPTTYNAPTDNLPLVLALHGLGDSKENFNNFNGFKALAESEKFILVTPQAEDPTETVTIFGQSIQTNTILQNAWHSGAGGNSYTFNGIPITLPVAYYVSESRDDVGFLSALIDSISTNFNIDSNRIYSTGFSMGGFMTNRLACELSNKIAAIASVSGTIGNEIKNSCNPDAIIPALHIHSINDSTVLYNNNDWGMDAEENVNFWIANNNCNTVSTNTDLTSIVNDGFVSQKMLYTPGDSASEVEFYHLEGPDHGGSWYVGNKDYITSNVIWDFFSRHKKVSVIEAEPTPSSIINIDHNSFELFPNPTSGKTKIEFKTEQNINSIKITNAIGKTILKQTISNNIKSINFDLSNYNKGIYFIQIEDNLGNQSVKRLIKN